MKNFSLLKFINATKGTVMVFIDAANLEQSVKAMWVSPGDVPERLKSHGANQLCWRVDYAELNNFFKTNCKLQKIRFYTANFERDAYNRFLALLKTLGFKLTTKPLKEYEDHTAANPHRKANFDVELAVDSLCNLDHYETFILFSGDSDFEYLLKFLRRQKKVTIVFSRKGHIAKELPRACHYYFDIIKFRKEFLRIEIRNTQKIPPKRDSAVDNK